MGLGGGDAACANFRPNSGPAQESPRSEPEASRPERTAGPAFKGLGVKKGSGQAQVFRPPGCLSHTNIDPRTHVWRVGLNATRITCSRDLEPCKGLLGHVGSVGNSALVSGLAFAIRPAQSRAGGYSHEQGDCTVYVTMATKA